MRPLLATLLSLLIRASFLSALITCAFSPLLAADFPKPFVFSSPVGSKEDATDAAFALGYQTGLISRQMNELYQNESELPVPVDAKRLAQVLDSAQRQIMLIAGNLRSETPGNFSLILSWGEVSALSIAAALIKIFPHIHIEELSVIWGLFCVADVVLTSVCLYHRYLGHTFMNRVEIPGSFLARMSEPFRQISNRRRKAKVIHQFKMGYLRAFDAKALGYSSRQIRRMGVQSLMLQTLHPTACQRMLAAISS